MTAAGVARPWRAVAGPPSWLYLPFDWLRLQRAHAVSAGLLRNSMLASRDFEHAVDAAERLTLGPWARRV